LKFHDFAAVVKGKWQPAPMRRDGTGNAGALRDRAVSFFPQPRTRVPYIHAQSSPFSVAIIPPGSFWGFEWNS
jgi:hypothetical protein